MPHRFAYLDATLPLAFAHRGGALTGRENTMAAFERSVELGFQYVETDARVTADGVLVAFHDSTLDRVTDRSGAIEELSWDQVRQAKVAGTDHIPLLEDVLASWPTLRVNIDPKSDDAVDPLVTAIRRTNAHDRVCVGAFSQRRLRRIRAILGPTVCTSLGPAEVGRLRLASWLAPRPPSGRRKRQHPIPCAQVPASYHGFPVADRTFIQRAHAEGIQVHVWTVDDPVEMARLLELGVDGIMTDAPETLREVYRERGLWPT